MGLVLRRKEGGAALAAKVGWRARAWYTRIPKHRRIEAGLCLVQLPATVARAIYYGDHLRLMCDLGHGQEQATVKRTLSQPTDAFPPPQPGDAVLLEFPPESTRIYAA